MQFSYQTIQSDEIMRRAFDTPLPNEERVPNSVIFPGDVGTFVRRAIQRSRPGPGISVRRAQAGRFGLISRQVGAGDHGYSTHNARAETVHEKTMFANSWEERRRCFIPAQAIYLKDHRKQKEVKISRQDRTPMAIAGLWDIKREPALPDVFSFTLLTVSAESHPFFLPLWHEEDDQNARMPALLPDDWIDEWLDGSVEEGVSILERHADVFYVAVPAGKRSRNPPTAKIQRL